MMNVIETIPVMEPVWIKVVLPICIATLMSIMATIFVLCRESRVIGIIGFVMAAILVVGAWREHTDVSRYRPTGEYYVRATFTEDFPFLSVVGTYEIVERDGDEFLLKPIGDCNEYVQD